MNENESCNLPSCCNCSQCQWWTENGFDVGRDPNWLDRSNQDEDEE